MLKDEDQNVLLRDEKIKEKWRNYFDRLYNDNFKQGLEDFIVQCKNINSSFMCKINKIEVKEDLWK